MVNVVELGNYVLFSPKDVKFLQNIEMLKVDVICIGTQLNDVYVLSASRSYVEKMSNIDSAYVWHMRLGHINMTKLN